jgi:hypothetical protein
MEKKYNLESIKIRGYFFIFLRRAYAMNEIYPKRTLANTILIIVFVLSSCDWKKKL